MASCNPWQASYGHRLLLHPRWGRWHNLHSRLRQKRALRYRRLQPRWQPRAPPGAFSTCASSSASRQSRQRRHLPNPTCTCWGCRRWPHLPTYLEDFPTDADTWTASGPASESSNQSSCVRTGSKGGRRHRRTLCLRTRDCLAMRCPNPRWASFRREFR